MSGSTIGGVVGGVIGYIYGGPTGAQYGFAIGSAIGGYVDPEKIYGPKLSDAQVQTSQEGVPIPFGYGTFPCAGNVVWAGRLQEHEVEEGGKGGPKQINYTYTRSYAIGICEGPISGIQQIKRNGKLVFDISPTSTIVGKSAKFLQKCTIYLGDETQTVDPTIEAAVGVGNSGPMRGLAYMVMEDDDLTESQGAIAQYEFVVQMCGDLIDATLLREVFLGTAQTTNTFLGTPSGAWRTETNPTQLLTFSTAVRGRAVAVNDLTNQFYYSTDDGTTWTASVTAPFPNRAYKDMATDGEFWVAIATDTLSFTQRTWVSLSSDGGIHWTEQDSGVDFGESICRSPKVFVMVTGAGGGAVDTGIWTSRDGAEWTQRNTADDFLAVGFNGSRFMAVGNHGKSFTADINGITWIDSGTAPGGGSYSFTAVTGQPGYFVVSANNNYGLFRTTDNGQNWTSLGYQPGAGSGGSDCATSGGGVDVICYQTTTRFSSDGGITWTLHQPADPDLRSLSYIKPPEEWIPVPDAPGLFADLLGELISDYAVEQLELSACEVTLGEIVADLCERAGIDPNEYDVSELTDTLGGYKCAIEASSQAFIDPLTHGFFFDRGEWDKKLRFPKRGGASVAAITMDDLVAREGEAIDQTRVQEVELLRRVNVMTIDPAIQYNDSKQSAERRIATIQAKAEATVEIPIVCPVDLAAQIADKRLKVAWAETDKFSFALPQEFSYLTPPDVITLIDAASVSHRVRLNAMNEETGTFTVEEAIKDRASTYDSVAVGVTNPNLPPPVDTVIGPTLLVAMNLPQLRSQDNTPGVYVGVCGVLSGWNGCAILLSLDGGVSYSTVLTVTNATTMGELTADMDGGGSPDVMQVRVFGTLQSKTTAQVAAGGNYSAVVTEDVAEVLAYEDATETSPSYYTLGTLSRGLLDTVADDHVTGDAFVDLAGVYFIPISADYEGETLYFKAVSFGLSADSVEPVTLVFASTTYILDGGGA